MRSRIRTTRGSSALRTATPSAGSASTSSPLARSTASIEPMRERWTSRTAVTTPIFGRAMAASWAISPPTYIPISSTAASCSGPIRSTVSGRPISLLALPSLFRVTNRSARTAAMASLVEVLAMLPVTPTTSGEKRRRQAAATACRPRSVSGTTIADAAPRASSASPSGSSETRRAAAPSARAAPMKRWPSVRSPGRATKRFPGRTSRESTADAGYRSFAGKHQLATGDGGYLGGGQGDRPRSGPRLRLAGIGHLSSVAQPTALGAGCGRHPSGVAFLVPGGGGPSGLGGICSVVTASVAIRRNSS